MTPPELRSAIAALSNSIAALGGPRLIAPDVPPDLSALASAVAPFELPTELVEFWALVDLGRLCAAVEIWPEFLIPDQALEEWRDPWGTEHEDSYPRRLLPIARSSWSYVAVELSGPDGSPGGTLFEYALDDQEITAGDSSIAARLNRFTFALEQGDTWFRDEGPPPRHLCAGDDAGDEFAAWALRHGPVHPVYGQRTFQRRAGQWPAARDLPSSPPM